MRNIAAGATRGGAVMGLLSAMPPLADRRCTSQKLAWLRLMQ
jgi:hypothetical protein